MKKFLIFLFYVPSNDGCGTDYADSRTEVRAGTTPVEEAKAALEQAKANAAKAKAEAEAKS